MSDKLKNLEARIAGEAEGPQGMKVQKNATISITLGELREVVAKAQAGCPIAAAYQKAIRTHDDMGVPDTHPLVVEKIDLEACLAGKCVEIHREVCPKTGTVTETKRIQSSTPTPSPKKTQAEKKAVKPEK